ncbi:MAG: DUF2191 domain-containing protein [Acidobacteriia bacterium]|nr:DUF2191 domain-containing protein [Terriglobia bacterium]
MRTTVRLNDALLQQAKRAASSRGQTLTSLIEQGLRLALARSRPAVHRAEVHLPVCTAGGGTLPGVDVNNNSALLDLLDNRA